jgi:hypothetical protein
LARSPIEILCLVSIHFLRVKTKRRWIKANNSVERRSSIFEEAPLISDDRVVIPGGIDKVGDEGEGFCEDA